MASELDDRILMLAIDRGISYQQAKFILALQDGDVIGDIEEPMPQPKSRRKDASFELQHPRYPKGHPRAGQFMNKPDLEAFEKLNHITDLIEKMPTSRHRSSPAIRRSLESIDKVLRFPEPSSGRKIKIVSNQVHSEDGAEANYDFNAKQVNLFDIRVPSDADPDVFVRRPFAESFGASSTVSHELAHWIDNELLTDGLDVADELRAQGPIEFGSSVMLGMDKAAKLPEGERSDAQEALLEWGFRVFTSDPYQHLSSLRGQTVNVTVGERNIDIEIPANIIDYLTNAAESWARSFEQYVANKSGDEEARAYIVDHRRSSDAAPVNLPNYWTADEFAPIEEAFDRLFASLGWSVPSSA